MRPALLLMMVAAAVLLAGCGYAGEPKPPALRRPEKVSDLAAVERGADIVVTFTLPLETTEGLAIAEPPDVELRVGVVPSPWSQAAWEASSDRVPVPATPLPTRDKPPRKPPPLSPFRKKAKASSPAKTTGRPPKRTSGQISAPDRAALFHTIHIDAAKYAGKNVAIEVRLHGPGGRDAGWSLVSLEVHPVLPVPRNLQAADAPNAIHLQWSADAPAFRIFRRLVVAGAVPGAADTDWVQIGESKQPSFDDKSFEYGKTWQYYVTSVRQTGDASQASDPSETLSWTPKDRFPPATPAGLAVIAGTKTMEVVWDRVADADLAGYRVYRNGQKVADGLATPSYSDKDVVTGGKYSYRISAVDQAGNESEQCPAQDGVME